MESVSERNNSPWLFWCYVFAEKEPGICVSSQESHNEGFPESPQRYSKTSTVNLSDNLWDPGVIRPWNTLGKKPTHWPINVLQLAAWSCWTWVSPLSLDHTSPSFIALFIYPLFIKQSHILTNTPSASSTKECLLPISLPHVSFRRRAVLCLGTHVSRLHCCWVYSSPHCRGSRISITVTFDKSMILVRRQAAKPLSLRW